MSQVFTLCGDDTITLNGHNLINFANDTVAQLTFNSSVSTMTIGKSGSAIVATNEQGKSAELTVRIMRGSDDDKFLNAAFITQKKDLVNADLINGTIVRHIGQGISGGSVARETTVLTGGIFTKQPDNQINISGDAEQGVVTYTLQFATGERTLG